MSVLETRRRGNRILEISLDEDAESLREWSNLGIMACSHPRYNLGDIRIESQEHYDEMQKEAIIWLPLYIYDHGGLSISVGPNPFDSMGWDTARVGMIYTTEERIAAIYGDDRPSDEELTQYLIHEVGIYSQYLGGEIYMYVMSESKRCSLGEEHQDMLESCGGFYDAQDILDETESHDWEVMKQ